MYGPFHEELRPDKGQNQKKKKKASSPLPCCSPYQASALILGSSATLGIWVESLTTNVTRSGLASE